MKNKKKKTKNIIIVASVFLVLALGIVASIFFSSRNVRIPKNPRGTIGNTAGNLNNGGLFVTRDNKVYFVNSFDNNTLYCMNEDETNIKKLSDAQPVNLLAAGNYLYFFQVGTASVEGLGSVRSPRSFVRCELNGSHATSIVRETIVNAQLVDDTLFLLGSDEKGCYLFRIGTDRKNRVDLNRSIVNPSAVYDGKIYYYGTTNNHYLYTLNPETNSSSLFLDYNMWYPCIEDSYIYFMDIENNYRLCRYGMNSGVIEILTADRVQSYNIRNGYIYYQTMGNNSGLYCMRSDGSNPFLLVNGEFTNISMTNSYVYFKNFFDPDITYHSPLGSFNYESFKAAGTAVGFTQE